MFELTNEKRDFAHPLVNSINKWQQAISFYRQFPVAFDSNNPVRKSWCRVRAVVIISYQADVLM